MVFKEQNHYFEAKKNYVDNIDLFNYPCIRPISFDDDLFCITESAANGRPLKAEELPILLRSLLYLFETQHIYTEDEEGIIYYVQHGDALPGNSWIDKNGDIFFVDIDGIDSRPALSDFFNVICRTQGFDYLIKAKEVFKKELISAFGEHSLNYTGSTYDLYLSKYVEKVLLSVKDGYNNGIVYRSVEWIFDPAAEIEFPLTKKIASKYKFESTDDGYKVL